VPGGVSVVLGADSGAEMSRAGELSARLFDSDSP